MAKVFKFDNSTEYKLKKAEEFYDVQDYVEALPLLFDVLKADGKNVKAKLLCARAYAEMSQQDLSTEFYVSVLADTYSEEAVKGIITNLLCQGSFKDARYYKENYKIDFDFSDFLTVETPDGDVLYGGGEDENTSEKEAENRRNSFKVVVDREVLGGENRAEPKSIADLTVEDLGYSNDDGSATFSFSELMEKLLTFDDGADDAEPRKTAIGFKQVYPIPAKDCEELISRAFNMFSAGKPQEAADLLDTVTRKNGKYYYLAQKNKTMCYLSLNRLASMKTAAEEALKGLPDDFTLKCYYYMSLKLLEEHDQADKLFAEIISEKPDGVIENMVKLDVCRLALEHQGVLDCTVRILQEYPYQPQFLLLRAKAEYNLGNYKGARAMFLDILRLYPDNFEAKTLLNKINTAEGGLMTYGEIELAIRRVKLMSEVNLLSADSRVFYNYLKYNRDALGNLEFLLLNETDRNVYNIVTELRSYLTGNVEELFKKLLLKITASEYLKLLLITYYLNAHYPKKLSVTVGRRLVTVALPRYGWEKNLTEHIIMAADMAIADIIMKTPNPEKHIVALTARLRRVSEYMFAENSDRETVRNLMDANDGVALKRVFEDLAMHNVRSDKALTIQDENYINYIKLLEKIEEDYEI